MNAKGCATLLVVLFVLGSIANAVDTWGIGVILWPIAALVALAAATQFYTHFKRKPLLARARLGRLKAEAGIPVATDGACRACGKPLLAGAKYCSYCQAPTTSAARMCPKCAARNLDNAEYCAE